MDDFALIVAALIAAVSAWLYWRPLPFADDPLARFREDQRRREDARKERAP